jgi:hypothetical protein
MRLLSIYIRANCAVSVAVSMTAKFILLCYVAQELHGCYSSRFAGLGFESSSGNFVLLLLVESPILHIDGMIKHFFLSDFVLIVNLPILPLISSPAIRQGFLQCFLGQVQQHLVLR